MQQQQQQLVVPVGHALFVGCGFYGQSVVHSGAEAFLGSPFPAPPRCPLARGIRDPLFSDVALIARLGL